MKKTSFLIIVIITGLALAGIIFIQFYWIRNALQLQAQMFDKSIQIALKGTVNQIYECNNDTIYLQNFCQTPCAHRQENIDISLNIIVLDSLIKSEFKQLKLKEPYVYGIYNSNSKKIHYISNNNYATQLINSQHYSSLSCIYKNNQILLAAWFPDEQIRLFRNILGWLILCFILLITLVFGFIFNIQSYKKQKKISEMKSDFINNITHEFKTPIATISLSSEMLKTPSVIASEAKVLKYANIIFDENTRLKNQIENILQLTVFDKSSIELNYSEIDIHELIQRIAGNFQLLLNENNGSIVLDLNADKHHIEVDKLYIENVLLNLLDNAVKYSQHSPEIRITSSNNNNHIKISVQDKGIGISSNNQKLIFQKLYRIPTGNLHNVKGFGIGLYYVKAIVEAHGGIVEVQSEINKGSCFTIHLPL